jgi:nucleoside-diphosphate-sugar epimerase
MVEVDQYNCELYGNLTNTSEVGRNNIELYGNLTNARGVDRNNNELYGNLTNASEVDRITTITSGQSENPDDMHPAAEKATDTATLGTVSGNHPQEKSYSNLAEICRGKHVWVLGGTGFIGQAVVQLLLDSQADVTMLVRPGSSAKLDLRRIGKLGRSDENVRQDYGSTDGVAKPVQTDNSKDFHREQTDGVSSSKEPGSGINPKGARLFKGDLRSLRWESLAFDAGRTPDAIIHLARIPGRRWLTRWVAGFQGGAASRRLLRWLETLSNPPHTVYVSGTLVYGDRGLQPADETTPLNPIAFQRDYVRAELPFLDKMKPVAFARIDKSKPLPVSVVRPPWVIGDGSWFRQFYVNTAFRTGKVPVFGSGDNLMSLIHVEDCAAQIIAVALGDDPGHVYNLCSMLAVSQREFVDTLCRQTGAKPEVLPEAAVRRKYGRTLAEALLFSVNAVSRHALIRNFPNRFMKLEEAMKHVIQDGKDAK